MNSTFECLGCGAKWKANGGGHTICARGHPYVRWVNFRDWLRAGLVGVDSRSGRQSR